MPMLEGSPIEGPSGMCILLLLAIYLMCQCAVNYATFRDACNPDTRWSMLFNVVNTFMAAALIIFVCAKITQCSMPTPSVSPVDTSSVGDGLFT